MSSMNRKLIHQLKKGDVIQAHGAVFEITEDAYESNGHRPQVGHLVTAHGPSDCAVARSVCIGGKETTGYIRIGKEWVFQGNQWAGQYEVLNSTKH